MEEMPGPLGDSIYESEKGLYPFSVVKRLPDVIPGNDASVRERNRMERMALYEHLQTDNPDNYPWPGAPEEIDPYCPNRDPANGPMNWDMWYNYCMRQTERRSFEQEEKKNYFCYVCKKKGSQERTRPTGGYPTLTEFPDIPKQERWQDIDNITTSYGITYCPGFGPDKDADDFTLTHDLTAAPSYSQ
eukprot:6480118-Amphidinium_carterae.1